MAPSEKPRAPCLTRIYVFKVRAVSITSSIENIKRKSICRGAVRYGGTRLLKYGKNVGWALSKGAGQKSG